jgi:transmembrane sensor
MQDYVSYELEDFLADDSFINYCFEKNESDVEKWESILNRLPSIGTKAAGAKRAVLEIQYVFAQDEKQKQTLHFKEQFYKKQQPHISVQNNTPALYPVKKPVMTWLKFAAAASVVLIAGIYFITKERNKTPEATTASVSYTIYTSLTDDRKVITLADGSTVLLNYNSTVKIPSNYNDTERNILLEGEAFFEVKENRQKPFHVITSGHTTTALGTSFLVRQYRHEANSKVELVTGKVSVVNTAKKKLLLAPGESAVENSVSGSFEKSAFSINHFNHWKSNIVMFNNTSFSTVLKELELYYGVTIEDRRNNKKQKHFTGAFHQKSLEHILDVAALLNHFSYTKVENKIILTEGN